jgi:hypothetical protein
VPTIELVVGYDRKNDAPLLARFLARVDDLFARFKAPKGKRPVSKPRRRRVRGG